MLDAVITAIPWMSRSPFYTWDSQPINCRPGPWTQDWLRSKQAKEQSLYEIIYIPEVKPTPKNWLPPMYFILHLLPVVNKRSSWFIHQIPQRSWPGPFTLSLPTDRWREVICQFSRVLDSSLVVHIKKGQLTLSCVFVPNWPHLGFLLSGLECGVGSWWAASGKPWCRVAAPLAHSWPSGWASDANHGSGCPIHVPHRSVTTL